MEIVDSVPDSAKPHVKHKMNLADFYLMLRRMLDAGDERWVKEVYSTPNAAASAVTRFLKDGGNGQLQVRRDGATVYIRLNAEFEAMSARLK